jgi:hypothetical protein
MMLRVVASYRIAAMAIAAMVPVLQGCATIYDPVVIPPYAGPIAVHVSSGTVSTMTETPAADHLVENSQVFLGRKEGVNAAWMLLGPLGAMIGASAARSANSAQAGDATETLALRFDGAVKQEVEKQGRDRRFAVTLEDGSAQLLMLPSARLVSDADGQATAEYRLTVRFVDPAKKSVATKNYYLTDLRTLPIKGADGWAGNGAASLERDAKVAFEKLVGWTFAEVNPSQPRTAPAQDPRKVKIQFPGQRNALDAIVRGEVEDHLAVSYVLNGRVLEKTVSLVPKRIAQ